MKYLVLNNFNHSFTVGVKGEYLSNKSVNDLGGELNNLIEKGLIKAEEENKPAPVQKPEPKPEPKAEFKSPPKEESKSKKSKGE